MQKNKTKFKLLTIILITLSSYSYSQNTQGLVDEADGFTDCDEIVSGIEHGHITNMIACENPILITSTDNDIEGSIITGTFTSLEKITITSGPNGTRIIASNHSENDGGIILTHGNTHIKIKRPSIFGGRFANFKKNKETTVSVFPNPTKNTVQIKANKTIEKITIVNIYGSLLLDKDYNKNNKDISLNLEKYKKGLYLVKIKLENDKLITKKIVKE